MTFDDAQAEAWPRLRALGYDPDIAYEVRGEKLGENWAIHVCSSQWAVSIKGCVVTVIRDPKSTWTAADGFRTVEVQPLSEPCSTVTPARADRQSRPGGT